MRTSTSPAALFGLLAFLLSGCGDRPPASGTTVSAAGGEVGGHEVPRPESFDGMEPQVADQIKIGLKRVEKRPDEAESWTDLGRFYLANDFVDLAVPAYRRALELDDRDPRRWYLLGRAQAELGDVSASLQSMDRALAALPYEGPSDAIDPTHGHDHGHGHAAPEETTVVYDEVNTAFIQWRRGFLLLEMGRADEAEAAFRRALELQPEDTTARIGLARVALERGNAPEAATILSPLVNLRTAANISYARDLLGRAYQRMGRESEAAPLLATEPLGSLSWPDPWNDRVYQDRKRLDWMIVQAHLMISAGHAHEAVHYLYDLEYYHGENPLVLKILGQAYFADGQMPKAIETMRKAVTVAPDDFAAHLNLGHVLEQMGEWDEALEMTARAHEIRPDNPEAHFQLMRILVSLRDLEGSLAEGRVLMEKYPNEPAAYAWLALAQAEAGDLQTATETLSRGAAIQARHPDVVAVARHLSEMSDEGR